jgi:uncharacterized protein YbaP (TraB family)
MLWRIEATDVFVFGGLHLGHESFYPLPTVVEKSFAEAKHVWFEAPSDDTFSRRAYCSGIGLLRKLLSLKRLVDSIEVGQRSGLNLKTIIALRPWALAITVTNKAWEVEGFTREYGLECQLLSRAKQAQKLVRHLETANDQLDIYDSAPWSEQNAFLDRVLYSKNEISEECLSTVQAWRRRDRKAFDESVAFDIERYSFFETLLFGRNRKWLPKFKQAVDEKIPTFICVGASHLSGKESLIVLLQREFGYILQLVT